MQENSSKKNLIKKLKSLLRQMMILVPNYDKGEMKEETEHLFNQICSIVFNNNMFLSIWDEAVLRKLMRTALVKQI